MYVLSVNSLYQAYEVATEPSYSYRELRHPDRFVFACQKWYGGEGLPYQMLKCTNKATLIETMSYWCNNIC